ncbi:MAG: ORC1-type DNA replication protein [Methanomethylovorans sp.]|nr:ORC1-type DNA replication protein [Methanomethylovorans sp.]
MSKDILMWDETIFRNPEILELDHVPEYFAHRDSQLQSLKFALKPALRGLQPLNCLVRGPPGTGKTTAVKKVFTELQEHVKNVIFIKINCQIDSTRFAVITKIYENLLKVSPPSSGVSFRKVFHKVVTHLINSNRILVIALDDINYLFHEGHADEVMYSLLRAHEQYTGVKIGVIAIVSDTGNIYKFDPRVGSVFLPEEIIFPRYEFKEIEDIISNRAFHAFFPNVVNTEVQKKIVEYTDLTGDLRIGIDLLKRAGLNAERRASRTISLEDVEKAYEASRLLHLCRNIGSLNENEKTLLRLIALGKDPQTGELYKEFHESTNLEYTRFYELIEKLNSLQYIDADFSGKGMRGRTRIIKTRYNPADILHCLEK